MAREQRASKLKKRIWRDSLPYRALELDNLYLVNGYSLVPSSTGSLIVVENKDSLARAVADYLALNRSTLSHRELRFLRRQMDLTQAKLADALGVTDQTVARCEKGESKVSGPIARLVRVIYAFKTVPLRDRLAWLDRIYLTFDRESHEGGELLFRLTPNGWVQADEVVD